MSFTIHKKTSQNFTSKHPLTISGIEVMWSCEVKERKEKRWQETNGLIGSWVVQEYVLFFSNGQRVWTSRWTWNANGGEGGATWAGALGQME